MGNSILCPFWFGKKFLLCASTRFPELVEGGSILMFYVLYVVGDSLQLSNFDWSNQCIIFCKCQYNVD